MILKDMNESNKTIVEVKETKSRAQLIEGRSYGVGFAFLAMLGEGVLETITPFSTCKDYLNDVLWVDKFKRPLHVFGLRLETIPPIFDQSNLYLGLRYLDTKRNGQQRGYPAFYSSWEEERDFFKANISTLQKYINKFEQDFYEALGIKADPSIIFSTKDPETFIVSLDKIWGSSIPAISLYTAVLRTFMGNKELTLDYRSIIQKHIDNKTIESHICTRLLKIFDTHSFSKIIEGTYNDPGIQAHPSNAHNRGFCFIADQIKT